jgi:hypothetical protein
MLACRVLGWRPERLRRVRPRCASRVATAPTQLGPAVEQIVRQRSQAVEVVSDGMYFTERVKLQELMQTTPLPTAYQLRDHVIAGGLLSYGTDIAANWRSAAKYVDKIYHEGKVHLAKGRFGAR